MGVLDYEARGVTAAEKVRALLPPSVADGDEDVMDIGGVTPPRVPSPAQAFGEREKMVRPASEVGLRKEDAMEVDGVQNDKLVGQPDPDTMDIGDSAASIKPASDVVARPVDDAIFIFRDADAAKKFSVPTTTPGGKKAWLRGFEEKRQREALVVAEEAAKRAKTEETATAVTSEPPAKTKLTLKDFMNKRMQSSTNLSAVDAVEAKLEENVQSKSETLPTPADVPEAVATSEVVAPVTSPISAPRPALAVASTPVEPALAPVKASLSSVLASYAAREPPSTPLNAPTNAAVSAQFQATGLLPSKNQEFEPQARSSFTPSQAETAHPQSYQHESEKRSLTSLPLRAGYGGGQTHSSSAQPQTTSQTHHSTPSFRDRLGNYEMQRMGSIDRDMDRSAERMPSTEYGSYNPVTGRYSPPSVGQAYGQHMNFERISRMGSLPDRDLGAMGPGTGPSGRMTPPRGESSQASDPYRMDRFRDREIGFTGRGAYLSSGGSLLSGPGAGARIGRVGVDTPSLLGTGASSSSLGSLRNRTYSADEQAGGDFASGSLRDRLGDIGDRDRSVDRSRGPGAVGERDLNRPSLLGPGYGDRISSAASLNDERYKRDMEFPNATPLRDRLASGGPTSSWDKGSIGRDFGDSAGPPSRDRGDYGRDRFEPRYGSYSSLNEPGLSRPKSPPQAYYSERSDREMNQDPRHYDGGSAGWNSRYRPGNQDASGRDLGNSSFRPGRGGPDRGGGGSGAGMGGSMGDRGYRPNNRDREYPSSTPSGGGDYGRRAGGPLGPGNDRFSSASRGRSGGEGGDSEPNNKPRRGSGSGSDYRLPPPPPPPSAR
ncbi:hypothetical protein BC830DRAFT_1136575 [Chytriomyces sp. MP71]|nr:hypothetical protein BC830DRAFT_1136575 [Chytriomyces sp. MP71]